MEITREEGARLGLNNHIACWNWQLKRHVTNACEYGSNDQGNPVVGRNGIRDGCFVITVRQRGSIHIHTDTEIEKGIRGRGLQLINEADGWCKS